MINSKITFALTIVLLLSFAHMATAQNWQWARGATGIATATQVCSDASGHVYVAGYFLESPVFGADTVYDSFGPYQDVFVAKYDAAGNVLWVRSGDGYAQAYGLSADAAGNVYVAGDFYNDSVTFGGHTLIDPSPGAQTSNIFFVKYDSLGDLVWARNLGGVNNDLAYGLSTDPYGNVYLAGNFMGDSLSIDTITLQHLGSGDCFLAKFDPAGDAVWIRSTGAPAQNQATGVSTDSSGNIIMTGYFSGHYMYAGSVGSLISSPYTSNVFVIKYDSSGDKLWVRFAGGAGNSSTTGISTDASSNIYVTGIFTDTLILDYDTLGSIGYQSIFTAQYDSSGILNWAEVAGGRYVDQSNAISTDAAGHSYVTGFTQSDTAYFGNVKLPNASGNMTFVAEYDASGNALWAIGPGGQSDNQGAGVSCSQGAVFVAGYFDASGIVFGSDALQPDPLFAGQQYFFLAALDTSAPTGIIHLSAAAAGILVYPNPSTGSFYFDGLADGSVIGIYDMGGQIISTSKTDSSIYPVDLSAYGSGIYFYRISDQGATVQSGKMIVE